MMRSLIAAAACCFTLLLACAAPLPAAPKSSLGEQERSLLRKIHDRTELMRQEIVNHDEEIRLVTEKLRNIEDALQELKGQFLLSEQSQRDRIRGQESSLTGMVSDLKRLESRANDSSSLISGYEQQIAEMDEMMRLQAENVEDLKRALKAVMDAVGAGEGPIDSSRIYHVQPGDSLGLIAKKHNATIREIKELNGLKNDTIIVGQKLKLPER